MTIVQSLFFFSRNAEDDSFCDVLSSLRGKYGLIHVLDVNHSRI